MLVKFMCYMRLLCLLNVLKFGAIWFMNDKFGGIKLRRLMSLQILEPPSSETTNRTQKVKVGLKNGTDILYPHAMFGGDLPPHCGERGKRVFLFAFLFLFLFFVTLMVCVPLGYRRSHCEGYIVAIYRSILMQFSAFLKTETPCGIFQKYLNYITRWRKL